MRLTIPSPTEAQREYAGDLRRKLRLSDASLDQHCQTRFGRDYADLHRAQMTLLIDELITWKAVPGELQRALGQLDLFEVKE